jgi:hypothetical protein
VAPAGSEVIAADAWALSQFAHFSFIMFIGVLSADLAGKDKT